MEHKGKRLICLNDSNEFCFVCGEYVKKSSVTRAFYNKERQFYKESFFQNISKFDTNWICVVCFVSRKFCTFGRQ